MFLDVAFSVHLQGVVLMESLLEVMTAVQAELGPPERTEVFFRSRWFDPKARVPQVMALQGHRLPLLRDQFL